ncbi:hypothetical protein Tco_0010316 [Tanacetum coccineum]
MKEAPRSPSPSRSRSVFSRLGSEARRRKERQTRSPSQASSRSGSVFTRLGAKSLEQRRRDTREHIKSYVTCSSERQRENQREYRHREREASSGRKNNKPLESEDSVGGRHWKRHPRKTSRRADNDLSEPYNKESTSPLPDRLMSLSFRRGSECLPDAVLPSPCVMFRSFIDQLVLSHFLDYISWYQEPKFLIKMPKRRNRNINDVYEQEFEQRIIARMEERLDQFVDQLAGRMNDMMNPRRCGDRNGQRSEGEELENPFFEGDGSSSDE